MEQRWPGSRGRGLGLQRPGPHGRAPGARRGDAEGTGGPRGGCCVPGGGGGPWEAGPRALGDVQLPVKAHREGLGRSVDAGGSWEPRPGIDGHGRLRDPLDQQGPGPGPPPLAHPGPDRGA